MITAKFYCHFSYKKITYYVCCMIYSIHRKVQNFNMIKESAIWKRLFFFCLLTPIFIIFITSACSEYQNPEIPTEDKPISTPESVISQFNWGEEKYCYCPDFGEISRSQGYFTAHYLEDGIWCVIKTCPCKDEDREYYFDEITKQHYYSFSEMVRHKYNLSY